VKTLFFRHPWLCSGGFAGLLALCSVAVHPSGSVKRSQWQAASVTDLRISPEIGTLLKRSCMDCHSNRTAWPWYSYVAPMSWLVERDVRRGRDYINLSEWDQYTSKQREKFLADIASVIKNREMPLPQYTLIHRDANLSNADTDLLYAWARAERRRLKAKPPGCPNKRRSAAQQPLISNASSSVEIAKRDFHSGNIVTANAVLLNETHARQGCSRRRKQLSRGIKENSNKAELTAADSWNAWPGPAQE